MKKIRSYFFYIVIFTLINSCNEDEINLPHLTFKQTFSVEEFSASGTIIDTVEYIDPEDMSMQFTFLNDEYSHIFDVDIETGILKLINADEIDFFVKQSYELAILITDPEDTDLIAIAEIVINVVLINTSHKVEDIELSVSENTVNNTIIGQLIITDREDSDINFSIVEEKFKTIFSINATGTIEVLDKTFLDYETQAILNFTVLATDAKQPEFIDSCKVKINILDVLEVNPSDFSVCMPFNGDANDLGYREIMGVENNVEYFSDRFNIPGMSPYFDGFSTYISYGDNWDDIFAGENKQFTISAWIKFESLSSQSKIFCKSSDSNCGENERQFFLTVSNDEDLVFVYYSILDYGASYRLLRTEKLSLTPFLGQWLHVSVSYDGNNYDNDGGDRVKIYLNGESQNLSLERQYSVLSDYLSFIPDGSAHFSLGNVANSQGTSCIEPVLDGKIDDFVIYDRILNLNEINSLMESDF